MRVDKFLKVSRIVKRRTLAKEICDGGRVTLNGRPAKAGDVLKVGDLLAVQFGPRRLSVRVRELRESCPAALAGEMYEVIGEEGPGRSPAGT